jgi:hypothetical protein
MAVAGHRDSYLFWHIIYWIKNLMQRYTYVIVIYYYWFIIGTFFLFFFLFIYILINFSPNLCIAQFPKIDGPIIFVLCSSTDRVRKLERLFIQFTKHIFKKRVDHSGNILFVNAIKVLALPDEEVEESVMIARLVGILSTNKD